MVRKVVTNHQTVAHGETTLKRIKLVRKGARLKGKQKVFGAAYRPLDFDLPSPTVTRSGFRDFVHPTQDRCCTVRELARLQSFPDGYTFEGRRCDTYAKSRYVKQTQHEQVGNAVPPVLAHRVAAAIRGQLFDGQERQESGLLRRRFAAVFERLDKHYPTADLGNKKNPLDELIYIMLSRRARESQYQECYRVLSKRFRKWESVLDVTVSELAKLLKPLGLANQRAFAIHEMLATIRQDFGRVSLHSLYRMTYSEAYNYLRSLPGVNDKTAKCVMLYALDLPALPVDTHTLRVSKRLGFLPESTSLFLAPRHLETLVERARRGRYHVLTVLHGREICTPTRPKCHLCPVRKLCVRSKVPRSIAQTLA